MTKKNKLTLVLVESPAKSKSIQIYLGNDYIVLATKGHIYKLTESKKFPLGVDIEGGFIPQYCVSDDKKTTVDTIINAAKKCDQIFLCADNDREGTGICFHILEQIRHLNIPCKRVLFNEITKAAILKAITNPEELKNHEAEYKSQTARRVLDRLVGFKVSPYLMKNMGGKLSAGRVQSVAARLIIDREREIEQFIPEEFWNITAQLAKSINSDDFTAKYIKKITNKEDAELIKKDLDVSSFVITDIEAKSKLRNPFAPFTTSKMLQACHGKYKFNTKRTSDAAQKLYEQGYCTYIRTDSVRSSPESIKDLRDWLVNNKYDIPDKENVYKNVDAVQNAHECIRPTDINLLPSQLNATDDEIKVYKLIWERFVGSQMKSAIYDLVKVLIKSSKNNHELQANGSTIKYKGWMELTEDFDEKKKDDKENNKLPILNKNDKLILVEPKVLAEQKFTLPPPRYNEQSLIKTLESKGIGRPSTYSTIMTTITKRDYVESKKDAFWATDLGKNVVDLLVKHFPFMNYEFTADMEVKLDKIAEGKLKYLDMMNEFYIPFENELKTAYTSSQKPTEFNCDLCGKSMILKHGKFGTFLACSGYSNSKTGCKSTKPCEVVNDVIKIVEKKKFEPVLEDGAKCPKCGEGMVKRNGKFGDFLGCSKYPSCSGISKVPYGKKCPECKNELTLINFSGDIKLSCMGYPGCRYIEELPNADGSVKKKKTFFKKKTS